MESAIITILMSALIVLLVILSVAGVFLIKLLIDLSKLTTNLDETTTLVKHELEPTLFELRQTLQSLNAIAGAADKQVENIKSILGKIISIPLLFLGQFKSLSGGFAKGLITGAKMFSKQK